jgi:diphthamide biosynthesis enzyme Dph1/Dph2-like protein
MYNLELGKAIETINKQKAKQVLIQLPDGIKHKANDITDFLEKNTKAKILIWFGGTFGACDLPLGMDILNIDLVIQWGHNKFNKEIW